MKRLLIQTQLSNYDSNGKFILECDSGWQMVLGRVRQMLALNSELHVTIMCPCTGEDGRPRQLITDPWDINQDLWEKYGPDGEQRLEYFEHNILANALVTRYDFNWSALAIGLNLGMQKMGLAPKWDAVYINDPMHLRNFKAMFHVVGGYQPKFYVHSHFIDNPECPKFPEEASLWLGQCEAAIKADYNFWQCESAMNVFFDSMSKQFTKEMVDYVKSKSSPWDDGYSSTEINLPVNESELRFTKDDFKRKTDGKIVIFVPNRIGGLGRSSDYTNCGKFMFELLPQLRKRRQDFVVIAGNPSQKFLNSELETMCGEHGYISLTDTAFNREEFKFVAKHSDIALGLYDQDSYGGTAARECIDLGCMPLWLACYEYDSIAKEVNFVHLGKSDFSDIIDVTSLLIDIVKCDDRASQMKQLLRRVVRQRCAYEQTTFRAMKTMGLLSDEHVSLK